MRSARAHPRALSFIHPFFIAGARALRAVCEEIMLDLMYRLPDEGQGGKYVITEEVVDGKRNLFEIKPEKPEARRKESA